MRGESALDLSERSLQASRFLQLAGPRGEQVDGLIPLALDILQGFPQAGGNGKQALLAGVNREALFDLSQRSPEVARLLVFSGFRRAHRSEEHTSELQSLR